MKVVPRPMDSIPWEGSFLCLLGPCTRDVATPIGERTDGDVSWTFRLEPRIGKPLRVVPRGERTRNGPDLPDYGSGFKYPAFMSPCFLYLLMLIS